mgnify:CR=1 FL=1
MHAKCVGRLNIRRKAKVYVCGRCNFAPPDVWGSSEKNRGDGEELTCDSIIEDKEEGKSDVKRVEEGRKRKRVTFAEVNTAILLKKRRTQESSKSVKMKGGEDDQSSCPLAESLERGQNND